MAGFDPRISGVGSDRSANCAMRHNHGPKFLLMSGFDPGISGVGSDRSTNCAMRHNHAPKLNLHGSGILIEMFDRNFC